MLGMRGAPEGPNGHKLGGACGVGGEWGHSGDAGLDRDDFLAAEENILARLFFFLSVFSGVTLPSIAAANGSPKPPSINVIVKGKSRSINVGRL